MLGASIGAGSLKQ